MSGLRVIFILCTVMGSLAYADSYRNIDQRACPILDTPYRMMSGLEIGYLFPSATDAAAWGDLSVYEIDAWVRFLSWENEVGGELEIHGQLHNEIWYLSGGVDAYPLTRAEISFQWNQRFIDGYGLQLVASPGLHSELAQMNSDAFSVPIGLIGIKAFSGDCAIYGGLRIYPGFQRSVDPTLGILWSNRDRLVIQTGYPDSSVEFSPSAAIRLILGARMLQWPEYSMGDDPRERIQSVESRCLGRMELKVTEFTIFSIESGYAFNRKISFQSFATDVEVDNATYIRVGIHGSM